LWGEKGGGGGGNSYLNSNDSVFPILLLKVQIM